ncbi:hypothetical protein FBU30_002631 [Linnemannia zychae]|nr:hypothetical protein FBU30_002631 [Linnemannia zychae]
MIRNSAVARQVIASRSIDTAKQTARNGAVLFRAKRRRAGTHAVFLNSTVLRGYTTNNTTRILSTPRVQLSTSRSTTVSRTANFSYPTTRFSTSSSTYLTKSNISSQGRTNVAKTGSAAIEGDVIYRREGDKIVPVAGDVADQVEVPVSGLFSQFEDFKKPSSSSEALTPRSTGNQDVDLNTLTIANAFPPDNFVTQLIQQKKLGVTLNETKDLVQMMIEVLPLKENDSKRIQAEKAFAADGAPLALALFKIALEQGDIPSRYSYGVLLYRGARGVPADPAKGRAIIESLALPKGGARFKGLPWAMSTLASMYARDDKNFEAARDLYLQAAQAGVIEARVALGRMYLNGELPQDLHMAKKQFQLAIQQSDDCAEAHFLLGALEMSQFTPEGEKRTPNAKAAFQHYQKAASKGLAEAQYNVGQAYFTGLGVPKNDALAVEYWKMSGQQGFGLAQLSLGAYYFQDETPQAPSSAEGSVIDKDGEKSTQSSKAVKHVWDPSKKDLMQAQKWFTLASRRPGQLGLEGQRLKAQVDEAIKRGGGGRKGGRMCTIM